MKTGRALLAGFGAAITLFWFATNLPWLPYKTGDWLFWGALVAAFPFILYWLGTMQGELPRRIMEIAALLHAAFLLWVVSRDDAAKLPSLVGWQRAGVALVSTLVSLASLYGLGSWWRRRTRFDFAPLYEPPSPRLETWSLAALFLFLVTLYEPTRGFPLFFWTYTADAIVLVAFGFFTLRVFYGEPERLSPPPRRWLILAWPLAFAIWGAQSVAFLREASLHHWSFYVGPLTLVRQGGWLLHDVPSQYGFLSVLFPAALPLEPFRAFHFGSSLFLLAQALLVFSLLLKLPLRRHATLWAGLMTFCLVYWLPGDRSELGALSYPNTGAYRFFWTLLLGVLLAYRNPTEKLGARTAAIVLVYSVSCFWAWESAVFASFILGFALLADLIGYVRNPYRKTSKLELLAPYVFCSGCVAAIAFAIQGYYLHHLGVMPDWAAFNEFSKSYSSTFAVSAISANGAINCLLVLFVAQSAFLFHQIKAKPDSSLRFLALHAVVCALFTYFVVRSHSVNVYTLVAIWIPCLAALFSNFHDASQMENETGLSVFTASCVLFFSISLSNFPNTTLGNGVHSLAYSAGVARTPDSPWTQNSVRQLDAARNHALPWVNLAKDRLVIPTLSIREFEFSSLAPLYPSEQFCILSSERRAIYLERAFHRRTPKRIEMLTIKDSKDACLLQILAHLDAHYEVVDFAALPPDLSLFTLEARR